MFDDKDIYKSMLAFAQAYSDVLASLNQRTLNYFESDLMKSSLRAIAATAKTAIPNEKLLSPMQESLKLITRSYIELLDSNSFRYTLNDSLNSVFADIQVNTLLQLSRSAQTKMIHELTACFANARYNNLVDVLNQTISSTVVAASDIAFIKNSKLVDSLSSELDYPRGLSRSLNALSKVTANDIATNENLEYNTESNKFISVDGETDSVGLNVICSGKHIFNTLSNELFSEIELINFCSYLYRTPMLAFQTETGKKIYEFLQELFLSGIRTIEFDKNIYYHCRSHSCDAHPFTYDQMLMAPTGLPWARRFNQVGRSCYYFADTRNGAEAEVKKHKTNDDVLQTVKLRPVKNIRLLDLSGTLARGVTFLRYLRFSLRDNTDNMPREYLIPCYVSECCRMIGFEGIKYYGSKEYSNYVVWNDGYFDFAGMCE